MASKPLPNPSRAAEVAALAEALGQPLLPWQLHALEQGLIVGPDGLFVRRRNGVLVARQNGKSHLMRMLVLAYLFLFDEQPRTVVSMAQNLSLALDQFKKTCDLVRATPWLNEKVKRVSATNGRESLELFNGSKWQVVAATADASRGRTADLLWVDELRDVSEEAWKAATPMTRAVKGSQIWFTSNAGDSHSTVLNDLREIALAKPSDAFGWFEWSADPMLDPKDRRAWAQANPALGHLIEWETLEQESLTDRPEAFRTEALCLWIDNIAAAWPYGKLDEATDRTLQLQPGEQTWLAIDCSPDRKRADLVAGQLLPDGRIAVGLVESWTSDYAVDDLKIAGDVAKWARFYNSRAVAFDRWTGSAIASRLASVGIPVGDVSGGMFAQACDETLSALQHGRIVHAGQPELLDHMNACVRRPTGDGGWRVYRKAATTPISAAVGLIMVVHFASRPAPEVDVMLA